MTGPAESFICAVCGQSHSGLSTDTAFTLPDVVWAIPEAEREQHAKWTSDLCQLGERYFIRCLLPINFIDQPGYYGWGIWAEVDWPVFKRYLDLYDADGSEEPPVAGLLSNEVAVYGETVGLPVSIQFGPSSKRPTLSFAKGVDHTLREDGFAGSGRTFRRTRDGWVHVVNVQSSRWGGQFAINLGLQPLSVIHVLGELPDPKKITEPLCEFRRRLSDSGADQWWAHEPNQESMNTAVEAACNSYITTGRALFAQVCGTRSPFDVVAPEEFAHGNFDFGGFGSTQVRMALVLARLRRAQGRVLESAAFAKVGLAGVGNAVALRLELRQLAEQQ